MPRNALCTMLLVACTVFPLHGLYDEYIAPKWYAGGYAALLAVVTVCTGKKHYKRTKTPSIAEKNMCEQQKKPIAICHLSIIYYLCNRKEEHDGVIAGSVLLLLQ